MRGLAALLFCLALPAQAGVAAYDACLADGFNDRVLTRFFDRFPHETCDGPDCDPRLMQSAIELARADCREIALDDCASGKCRMGLEGRWVADGKTLRAEITARLSEIDVNALPALQSRRLSNPGSWLSPVSCTGDAAICSAVAAGQALEDLTRIHGTVMALP